MGRDEGQPYYTVDFLWTLSYPSESWIARRASLWVIMAAIGLAIIYLGGLGPVSWVGLIVVVLAQGYGVHLAQVGYENTRRRREAQGLPPDPKK